jgi:uncharacterized protein with von Willebrand factor type A (vWA) domain
VLITFSSFTPTKSRSVKTTSATAVLNSTYIHFASSVTRVGDEVNDVTSVNTALHRCTGKEVRLNLQFEITYGTTVVEFNTTMAVVVLMERCYFVSAGNETEAMGHFTCYLCERRG